MTTTPRTIELLAPARDAAVAIEAVRHGADAVYMGAEGFGARAAVGNSVDDIRRVVDFARRFRARVYVTVNTIVYDRELPQVERLIRRLYDAGVDALIVQDMGVLRLDIPPVALHASTQCDVRTPAKARFLQDVGFSQIVLPREMSLAEIEAVRAEVSVPLEAFVHGALCVSYSGDCQASQVLRGRSANRGECAQICRLPYDLYDGRGRCVERGRHFLSLRDMNRSLGLLPMLEAGISSFKIEGRLKDAGYVKNVVSFYHRRLQDIVESNPEKYVRASAGRVDTAFTPALHKSFNRGFTTYFLDGADSAVGSIYTPKSQGERVGVVVRSAGAVVEASLDVPLANGDGLGFFDSHNEFVGFRLNRVEGFRLFPAVRVDVRPGTVLYRNSDKAFDDILRRDTATRTVGLGMTLRRAAGMLVLDIADCRGNAVTSTAPLSGPDAARSPQEDQRRRTLGRLGGTGYRLDRLDDRAGDIFIPAAALTALRRDALALLDRANNACYRRDMRRPESAEARYPADTLDYHDNVANCLAERFYRSHGVKSIAPAIEVSGAPASGLRVMTTRYCLRRELGACLREGGVGLPGPLRLQSGDITLDIRFDCANCRMQVHLPPSPGR